MGLVIDANVGDGILLEKQGQTYRAEMPVGLVVRIRRQTVREDDFVPLDRSHGIARFIGDGVMILSVDGALAFVHRPSQYTTAHLLQRRQLAM